MNLQEFAALKPGDRIENAMSNSQGEVVEADAKGVSVRWRGVGMAGAGTIRHYSAQSTIWFHWSKVRMCPNGGPCTSDRCEPADQCLGGTKEQYDALAGVGPDLDRAISDELANPPASIVGDA